MASNAALALVADRAAAATAPPADRRVVGVIPAGCAPGGTYLVRARSSGRWPRRARMWRAHSARLWIRGARPSGWSARRWTFLPGTTSSDAAPSVIRLNASFAAIRSPLRSATSAGVLTTAGPAGRSRPVGSRGPASARAVRRRPTTPASQPRSPASHARQTVVTSRPEGGAGRSDLARSDGIAPPDRW
jgi:hypothetical protein